MKTKETELLLGNSQVTINILNFVKDNPHLDNAELIISLIEMQEAQIELILNLHNGGHEQFI